MTDEAKINNSMNRIGISLGLALFVAHVVLIFCHHPLSLGARGAPLASGDLSMTLGKAWDTQRGSETGGMTGYSPSYMAGYGYGLWDSVGRRAYEIGAVALPFENATKRYYWTIVGMCIFTPFFLGLAALGCRYQFSQAIMITGLSCIIYHLCDPVSYFWQFGNSAYPFASSITVAALAFSLPSQNSPYLTRSIFAGILVSLAIWAHTVAVIPLAIGGIAIVVIARRIGVVWSRLFAAAGTTALVAAILVLPGHWHLLSVLNERMPMQIEPLPSGIKYLVSDLTDDRAYRHPFDRRPLFHILLVLSTWQAFYDWRSRVGRTEGLWLAAISILLFGYAAGHISVLKQLQPYRFVVSADLVLIIPAIRGLFHFLRMIHQSNNAGKISCLIVGFAFAPSLTGYLWDYARLSPVRELSQNEQECVRLIREHRTAGRVLCEPGALGCLLPHLANCEVIGGGVSSQAVVRQGWTHVGNGRAFGQSMEDISPGEFLRYLRIFDVQIIISESESLTALIRRLPAKVSEIAAVGSFRIFRLEPGADPAVWEGSYRGLITAEHNRITIRQPPVGRLVLPYHYLRGFTGSDGVTVQPIDLPGFQAPLIGVNLEKKHDEVILKFNHK